MTIVTEVFADENRVIEREMTKKELADIALIHKASQTRKAAEQLETSNKAAAKASAIAKLEALGLNLEEAQAIFG